MKRELKKRRTRNGVVEVLFGAYIVRIVGPDAAWKTQEEEIRFWLPPGAEHTDVVWHKAQEVGSKKWKKFLSVQETWRY